MHFSTAANAYATGTEIIKYLTFLIFEIQDSIKISLLPQRPLNRPVFTKWQELIAKITVEKQ